MSNTAVQVEALLYALGRPLSHEELMRHLSVDETQLREALVQLRVREGGVTVVDDGREVELRVAAAAAEAVERVRKEEYSREVGKAGLEALAAVLYRGPLSRADIDFVRGVNSSQTLRTLSMRGLVRRVPNPKDARQFIYEPTTELLAQLGVARIDELPEYASVRDKLAALEEAYRASQQQQPAAEPND